jgi:Mg-chelatase subunit ChlD
MTISAEFLLLLPALALLGLVWRGPRLFSPLRAAVLVVAVLALADPRIRHTRDVLDLHVLLDRSASTGDLIDKGLPEWRRLLEQSRPSRRDSLRFHNYAAEVLEMGVDGSEFTGNRSLTRTALALSTLAAAADPNRPARVLVFTDGFSTEPLDEAAALLEARGIPLDFRLIRQENPNDIRVASMQLPARVQAGEPFLLGVELRGSSPDQDVPLLIRRDGSTLVETSVAFRDGRGFAEFTDRLAAAGAWQYEAVILPENDAHEGNNRASRWIETTAGPRVLWVTRYADDPAAAALDARDFDVAVVAEPQRLHPGMLTGTRAVVLNNVPANQVPDGFLKALDFFVREQGGGLMMAGGETSFGAGGYFESPVDALLPVSMELKSEHRKLSVAMAIVMDRSGSMAMQVGGGLTKMDLANTGAVNAIELLGEMDQVAVFAVDTEPVAVVPLTTIAGNRAKIDDKVRRIVSSGGGIFVYNGLKAAWDELKKSPAGTRHVILFTDAQDTEQPGDYMNLLEEMTENGCAVSVIGLGTPADVHAPLCEDIARRGGGRIFFSDQPMDIPQIFAQETVTIARSAFLKETTATQGTGGWGEVSPQPIDWPREVDGYNLSYARPDVTVALATTDEYLAPLVAHARRGLGRTAAVAFPLGGPYSEAVRSWPGFGDFTQTLTRFLMGEGVPPGVALRHRIEGTRLTVDLLHDTEGEWPSRFALSPPRARIQHGAGATATDVPWRRIAPGHFSFSQDLEENTLVRGAVRIDGHALPFGPTGIGTSVEWAFDDDALADLRAASARTGGRELIDLTKAWLRPPMVVETTLRPWLIALLLGLILFEVLVTRTGWRLPEFSRPARAAVVVPVPPPAEASAAVPASAAPAAAAPEAPGSDAGDAATTARRNRFLRAKKRK